MPSAPETIPAPHEAGCGAAAPEANKPMPLEGLVTAWLGQGMAGIALAMLSIGSHATPFPWWGVAITAAGMMLILHVISGLGKWEAPAILSSGLTQSYAWSDLVVGLLILFSMSAVVSLLSYFSVAFRPSADFTPAERLLLTILTPVILVEIGLLIAFMALLGWVALAWNGSGQFG